MLIANIKEKNTQGC